MGGYLVNFSVYTFAMVGFLYLAVIIYKKSAPIINTKGKDSGMVIEESLSLSPRKRLHVVRVNGEKFLIAADVDRTEFLAKLDNSEKPELSDNVIKTNKTSGLVSIPENRPVLKNVNNIIGDSSRFKQYTNKWGESKLSHIKNKNFKKPPMMRGILQKLEIAQG